MHVAVHVVGAGRRGSVVLMLHWPGIGLASLKSWWRVQTPLHFYTADMKHSTGCGGVCCVHPRLISLSLSREKIVMEKHIFIVA